MEKIGFKELIKNIQTLYKNKRNEIEESAQQITEYLQQSYSINSSKGLSEGTLNKLTNISKQNSIKITADSEVHRNFHPRTT